MVERIKEIIAEQIGIEVADITDTASFVDDLGIDSLDMFEMAMAIEEEYSVEIASEDLPNIKNVADIVKYIEEHK